MNIESVLQRNPDAIISSGTGSGRPPWLDDWRRYPTLAAVRNGALFYIDPDHIVRPTMRLLFGVETMCAHLDSVRQDGDG